MSDQLKFVYKKVSDLIPYVNNARTHNEEQIIKLASSIKEFGFMSPIIISEDGGVIAGHGRLMAAKKLGIENVPCIVESHLSEPQRKGYILADNRLSLDAGWDDDLLKIEMQTLKDNGIDLSLTGFDDDELRKILMEEKTDNSLIDSFDFGSLTANDGEKEKKQKLDVHKCPQCGHLFED